MIIKCPDCQAEISHTAKFCPRCGSTKTGQFKALAAYQITDEVLGKRPANVLRAIAGVALLVALGYVVVSFAL